MQCSIFHARLVMQVLNLESGAFVQTISRAHTGVIMSLLSWEVRNLYLTPASAASPAHPIWQASARLMSKLSQDSVYITHYSHIAAGWLHMPSECRQGCVDLREWPHCTWQRRSMQQYAYMQPSGDRARHSWALAISVHVDEETVSSFGVF